MVITGGIALFSVGMIFYKFHENKESEIYTNKPYKQYYTVYRYSLIIMFILHQSDSLSGQMIQKS